MKEEGGGDAQAAGAGFVREKVERKHGCLTRVEDKKRQNNPNFKPHDMGE